MAFSTLKVIRRKDAFSSEGIKLRPRIYLLWGMALIGVLLALGKNTPIFPFLYKYVPTFDMFQAPARYMLWPVFSLCLLAAFGIDDWKRPVGKALRRLRKTAFVILAAIAGASLAYFLIPGIKASFVYSLVTAGILGILFVWLALWKPLDPDSPRQIGWTWMVAILVGLDLFVAGWGQNPSVSAKFYETIDNSTEGALSTAQSRIYLNDETEYNLKFGRFLRFENYRLHESWDNMRQAQIPNLNILNGLSSANNFDPMRPARYDEWMSYLSSLTVEEREPWLKLMNVGQIQGLTGESGNDYSFQNISGGKWIVFSSCVVYATGAEDAWAKTVSYVEGSGGRVVIETDEPKTIPCNPQSNDKISILSEHPTSIVLDVDVNGDGWLIMADTWYPGWYAKVDGDPATLVRANYVFRGVFLTAGQHSVVIEYRPWWIWPSISISLLGILVMIFLLFPRRKSETK
jgi:hypothetical protein